MFFLVDCSENLDKICPNCYTRFENKTITSKYLYHCNRVVFAVISHVTEFNAVKFTAICEVSHVWAYYDYRHQEFSTQPKSISTN